MKELELVLTADGSKTLYHPEVGEHYHSKHGAVQESKHVFIKMGLEYFIERDDPKQVSIIEVGFGTGLNFLQTINFLKNSDISIDYLGIEAFPLAEELVFDTGYETAVEAGIWSNFTKFYTSAIESKIAFDAAHTLEIRHTTLQNFEVRTESADIVYFDAFAAIHQPEMWSIESLAIVAKILKKGGVFVTYAITGDLKRNMKSLGFSIEKVPGAPGKREMLRAIKI